DEDGGLGSVASQTPLLLPLQAEGGPCGGGGGGGGGGGRAGRHHRVASLCTDERRRRTESLGCYGNDGYGGYADSPSYGGGYGYGG
ncbi:unnamed protein product, partial [Ectocarpus fasciculatus]